MNGFLPFVKGGKNLVSSVYSMMDRLITRPKIPSPVKGEGDSGFWTLSQKELRLKAKRLHHPRGGSEAFPTLHIRH